MRKNAKYGWRRDLPDHRDQKFSVMMMAAVPEIVDLEQQCPPVYDQSDIGSCTANALGGDFHFSELKQKVQHPFTPSRLFIYWNERVIEGTTKSDAGAELRDGIKTLASQGVCNETLWQYGHKNLFKKPTKSVFDSAKKNVIKQYLRLDQNIAAMQNCLAQGYPFVFGFSVYDYFESEEMASTGILKMPAQGESLLGGHAVMAVGYNNTTKMVKVRNSWGVDWGLKGYFWMPFEYISNGDLSSDFWTIRYVSANG